MYEKRSCVWKKFIDSVWSQGPEFENESLFFPFSSFIVPLVQFHVFVWIALEIEMFSHGFRQVWSSVFHIK